METLDFGSPTNPSNKQLKPLIRWKSVECKRGTKKNCANTYIKNSRTLSVPWVCDLSPKVYRSGLYSVHAYMDVYTVRWCDSKDRWLRSKTPCRTPSIWILPSPREQKLWRTGNALCRCCLRYSAILHTPRSYIIYRVLPNSCPRTNQW